MLKTDNLRPVIDKYKECNNVLLILDIDDVVLSSKIGQKIVDI